MPRRPAPQSVGDQLAEALQTADVSISELARRLAVPGEATAASKRRWLQKILKDQVDQPDMRAVAVALRLPKNHFVLPAPEQVRSRQARLEELEAQLDELRRSRLQGTRVILRRLVALEAGLERLEQQSSRQSSGQNQ